MMERVNTRMKEQQSVPHYRFAVLDNCNTFCIDDWHCTFFPIQTYRPERGGEKKERKGTIEFSAASYNSKKVQCIPLTAYEIYMVVRNRVWLRLQTNLLHYSTIWGFLDSTALFRHPRAFQGTFSTIWFGCSKTCMFFVELILCLFYLGSSGYC